MNINKAENYNNNDYKQLKSKEAKQEDLYYTILTNSMRSYYKYYIYYTYYKYYTYAH